ncbi:metal-dependent phosphohydrolase HD domain-containing protein, partial [Cardiosporidium cionae]
IAQLGACKYVYPGATHTRFEHSLGVGQLARELFKKLAAKLNFSCQYGETARLLKCVQIAGLCHDLGHGPYSHTFESYFLNYRKPVEEFWSHETMSLRIVDELIGPLIDKGELDLDDTDLKAIKYMIKGVSPFFNSDNGWDSLGLLTRASFDIVANKRNGLDVDKFDYLRRDASLIFPGANIPLLDSYRLLNHCAVIDGEIVYNIQDLQAVWMVYFNRYSLNTQIYTHRKVRALELMDIRYASSLSLPFEQRKNLERAKNLLSYFAYGRQPTNLYRFTSEVSITNPSNMQRVKEISTEEIVARFHPLLKEEDIIVDCNTLDYGLKGNDPFDYIKFYSPDDEEMAFHATEEKRGIFPKCFQECQIRLYCKENSKVEIAKQAFSDFCISYEVETPQCKGTKGSVEFSTFESPARTNSVKRQRMKGPSLLPSFNSS